MTPADLLLRLWMRKFWICAILAVCLVLGVTYLKTAKPLYEIQANLLLEPGSRLLGLDKKDIVQRDVEMTATQAEVLSSWHLIGQAIASFQNSVASPLTTEEMHLILAEELTVKPIVGTRILNVSLRWDDREQGVSIIIRTFCRNGIKAARPMHSRHSHKPRLAFAVSSTSCGPGIATTSIRAQFSVALRQAGRSNRRSSRI